MLADRATDRATASAPAAPRAVGAYASAARRSRAHLRTAALVAVALALTVLLLTWDNRFEPFSDRWWRVASMRTTTVVVIALVTFCQAHATVAFQTVTNNRILTPSIMGFESMYVLIQTAVVFVFGTTSVSGLSPTWRFVLQSAAMVLFAVLLYSWLLSGRFGNLHVMLLVGIVLGTAMSSLSTFLQQLLDPSTFDVLRARLFGSIGNADTGLLWLVVPICAVAGGAVLLLCRRLDVLALGGDISTGLGIRHRRQVMLMLTLVAVLMAMSTSLVGPMTFLGFLSATLAYAVADTHEHRRVLPTAWLVGYVILTGAYFLLRHVFSLVDSVTIVVELIGGILFLLVVFRKGRL